MVFQQRGVSSRPKTGSSRTFFVTKCHKVRLECDSAAHSRSTFWHFMTLDDEFVTLRTKCRAKHRKVSRKESQSETAQLITLHLETNLASRWEGVRLPRASGKSPDFPGSSPKLPQKFFGDFPGGSLAVELDGKPGVPRKFPRLPRKFPRLLRKFPRLPRRSAPFSGKPDTLSWLAKTFSDN